MIGSVSQAHNAYNQTLSQLNATDASTDTDTASSNSASNFGTVLEQAVNGAIASGHTAESQTAQGLSGHGDMTQIVSAVSSAQLALQTTTVLRDRFVQAYQDVMRMSI